MIVSTLATVAVLAKLPKVSVSLPAPRSMLALLGGGAQGDGVGAGAADQRADVAYRAGVGAVGRVSVLVPLPRSTDMPVVSAVPRVMVSVPLPPVSVSTLPTVAVLVKLPRFSVSLPLPRSMLPLLSARHRA